MGEVKIKGYMTVEATFIIPSVIFLFVFIIYSSFYLYDRCVIFQDSYAYALRAAGKQTSDEEVIAFLNDNTDEQYGEKYISSGKLEHEYDVSDNEVDVTAKGSVYCGFAPGAILPDISRWDYHAKAEASRITPVETVRRARMIKTLGEYKKGSETDGY